MTFVWAYRVVEDIGPEVATVDTHAKNVRRFSPAAYAERLPCAQRDKGMRTLDVIDADAVRHPHLVQWRRQS
jgi:hypothetical protein